MAPSARPRIRRLLKHLYWKCCFPRQIRLLPPRLSVASGPFTGMVYAGSACGSILSPKIVGTYECELHALMEWVKDQPFDRIVDIGAAEGYYAVGLARFVKCHPDVVAFEMQPNARALMAEMARMNQADLRIEAECTPHQLAQVLPAAGNCLIVCDVEGYEEELLDPGQIPNLLRASILVEVHELARPGVTGLLKRRFQATHRIDFIPSRGRTWEDFPQKSGVSRLLPRSLALRAMDEARGCQMGWLWMLPCPTRCDSA